MDWWRKNTEPERKERTTAQTQWWAHNNAHAYMCRAVKRKHHKLSCRLSYLLSHLSMGQRQRERRRGEEGEGGGGTYILHLSVEERAWGQVKRLYHNLGHCLRRRAHGALALIRDRHTPATHTEKHRPVRPRGQLTVAVVEIKKGTVHLKKAHLFTKECRPPSFFLWIHFWGSCTYTFHCHLERMMFFFSAFVQ